MASAREVKLGDDVFFHKDATYKVAKVINRYDHLPNTVTLVYYDGVTHSWQEADKVTLGDDDGQFFFA